MPTDELERELRHAFARRAAGYQHAEQARERLLQRDYRPRGSQRRLTAGITAVTAAGAVALSLGLSGVFGSAAARGTATIRTDAFTLVEHANGTATLTFNSYLLQDPSALQRALRHDRIPAIVTVGRFCYSHPIPAGFAKAVAGVTAPYSKGPAPGPGSFTINPAALPAGTELSFGFFPPQNSRVGNIIELIDTKSYTCSPTAPPAPPSGDGISTEYAQPASP
jgi:hypothetical protein